MLVVATGHFNRIGISVAGAERIIPEYGIAPERMGMVYSAFLVRLYAGDAPRRLVHRPFWCARRALMLLGFGSTVFVALTGAVGLIAPGRRCPCLGLMVVRGLLGLTNAPLHPASARMVFDQSAGPVAGIGERAGHVRGLSGNGRLLLRDGIADRRFDWPIAFVISSGLDAARRAGMDVRTRGSREPDSARPGTAGEFGSSRALARDRAPERDLHHAELTRPMAIFSTSSSTGSSTTSCEIQHQGVAVARGYSTMITLAMGLGMISGGWLADRVPRSVLAADAAGTRAGSRDDRQRCRV